MFRPKIQLKSLRARDNFFRSPDVDLLKFVYDIFDICFDIKKNAHKLSVKLRASPLRLYNVYNYTFVLFRTFFYVYIYTYR